MSSADPPTGLCDDYTDTVAESAEVVHEGAVWDVVRERFSIPEAADTLVREVVKHPGAVAVAALDEDDRILLIQQYRQPIRARDWEIPAGLLDIAGEHPHTAAQRELAEEADLAADTWHVLADQLTSPGGSSEALRIYLARDLRRLPAAVRTEEESGIVSRWVRLDDALNAVLDGRICNATGALAILHLTQQRRCGFARLRPADASWPAREHLRRGLLSTLPTRLQTRSGYGQTRS